MQTNLKSDFCSKLNSYEMNGKIKNNSDKGEETILLAVFYFDETYLKQKRFGGLLRCSNKRKFPFHDAHNVFRHHHCFPGD